LNTDMACVGYVLSSTYRIKVMETLKGKFKTPTQIANDIDIRTNHISNVLRELKTHNLIVCVNEEARKGRIYKLTRYGNKIMKIIEDRDREV